MDLIKASIRLILIGGFFLLPGCQQDTSDYQDFSTIHENDSTDTTEVVAESDPNAVSQETILSEASNDSDTEASKESKTANAVTSEVEFAPLVAVKPVFGNSSKEMKSNIDNATSTLETREIKLLVEEPEFRKEEGATRVSYDDLDLLKVLNMEPVPSDAVSHFPPWMRELDGKKVRIRGFMYPPFRETGIDFFVLARDNQICCFGRNPKIYDLINVEMKPGVTTNYILNRPFDVVGTFHIRPEADEDELFNLYEISNAVVIDQ